MNNLFAHIGVPLLRVPVQEVDDMEVLRKRLFDGWDTRCRHLVAGETLQLAIESAGVA